MDDVQFGNLIDSAVAEIPEEFLEQIENVSIVISDYPSRLQMSRFSLRGRGVMLLGLYEGVPKIARRSYGIGGQLPDKITLFKLPILSVARGFNDLKEIVKNTVWHEIAHHFGLDESAVRAAERERIERQSSVSFTGDKRSFPPELFPKD